MNILLIGSGAREHAIAKAIKKSRHRTDIFCFASNNNPGILALSKKITVGKLNDVFEITKFARTNNIDWAFVGPEAPLEAGVVDELKKYNIPSVGPTKNLARLETSKSFARDLLTEYNIPACPVYKFFSSMNGVREFILSLKENYVIKIDGLEGGKGVKVSGDHVKNAGEGVNWCENLIKMGKTFVIEEKLIGQEFSFFSFSDGRHIAHMPAVQDHKRAYDGDKGPNTGGMGSYTDSNHSLPFLTDNDIEQAKAINLAAIRALRDKFKEEYKGILYGGFMATKDGVKLIEYNARFGDPECMNLLSLLESDFVELCIAIIHGNLAPNQVRFARRATVCKYAVPEGYPNNPIKNEKINVGAVENKDTLYYAAVDWREDGLYETGSRTIAVVGLAGSIAEAETIAEKEISRIAGPLFHRTDIGKENFIKKKVDMMNELRRK